MSKYIIKNCPCLEDIYDAEFDNDGNMQKILQQQNYCIRNEKSCDKVSDCLLKRIVEKCKDAQDECSCKIRNYVKCFECTSGGRAALGKEILEQLEIEEIENVES